MTTENKRQLRVLMWTVITGMVLLGATKMAGQVVLRPEFDAHVQSDTTWKREQKELTLEVLCELKPASRKCR